MKILHLSDLHIGKKVNEFNLIEDQIEVLKQAEDIVKNDDIDVVIIAGDIYDRSVPPVDAVNVANEFLSKIVRDLNKPVLAIAGNHDSGMRLEFAKLLLEKEGLYIEGTIKEDIKKVVIFDEYGPVNFYLIPYADPAEIREQFKNEDIKTYDDAMKLVIDKISENINTKERNIAIAHGFITYMSDGKEETELIESDSERLLSVGGTDKISAKYFEEFNYTALGHLHGAQKVGSDKIRYGGSILKYSFSEVNQKKVFTVVDINETGEVNIDLVPIKFPRDMRIIKGPLDELIKEEVYYSEDLNLNDYIKAILTDEGDLIDPLSKLRAVYPNLMEIERENKMKLGQNKTAASKGFKEKSELDLFKEFYKNICGEDLNEEQLDIVQDGIKDVMKDEVN